MADGLNKVFLMGGLVADPELKMTSSGQAVLKMRLACSESYLDKNKVRQERTEFVNAVLWGKRAEALAKFLTKGSRLFIEGGLRTSSYDDKDGNKRYKTEVVATNVIPSGKGGGTGKREGRDDRDDVSDSAADDPVPAGTTSQRFDNTGAGTGDDDDIPF